MHYVHIPILYRSSLLWRLFWVLRRTGKTCGELYRKENIFRFTIAASSQCKSTRHLTTMKCCRKSPHYNAMPSPASWRSERDDAQQEKRQTIPAIVQDSCRGRKQVSVRHETGLRKPEWRRTASGNAWNNVSEMCAWETWGARSISVSLNVIMAWDARCSHDKGCTTFRVE